MWGPVLDQEHVASKDASGVGPTWKMLAWLKKKRRMQDKRTPRIRLAPEDDGAVLVLGIAQNFVQHDGKAIQVADVQRTEVCVEGIVQEVLVNGKVDWGRSWACGGRRGLLCA